MVLSAALVPLRSAWRRLDAGGHSAGCLAPGSPSGARGAHTGFLPKGNQQLSRGWSHAPCCCQSLTSSLPSLADGGSKPQQLKKKRGAKHHFWPEHHGEAGAVALVFGRSLVLDGEQGLHSPPGKVMMGDEKSQLLEVSPLTPKGNQMTPPRLEGQVR